MSIVKALLILILTLFWGVISWVIFASSNSLIAMLVVAFIYGLLVYIVWPIGTSYSDVAARRLLVGLGVGILIVALNVLLNNECPNYPFNLAILYPKQSAFAGIIWLVCNYLGKYPAFLLLTFVGCYMIYFGGKLKILANPRFEIPSKQVQ